MLLGLASYASTAHEKTPHYDLDLLYHDVWRSPGRETTVSGHTARPGPRLTHS
jgi:hypothetical protein